MAGRHPCDDVIECVGTPPVSNVPADDSAMAEELLGAGRGHVDDGDDYLRSNYAFEMQLCERVSTPSFICRLFVVCFSNKLTVIKPDSHHQRNVCGQRVAW